MNNKKILLINGGTKQFATDFIKASRDFDIETVNLNSKECFFTILDNKIKLFNNNSVVDILNFDYAFIRLKGKSPHMTTLISRYLSFNKIPINDKVNLSETLLDAEENIFNDEKISQMLVLAQQNLDVPNTIIFSKSSYYKNQKSLNKQIIFPCVLKSSGAKGKAVWKIKEQSELEEKINESAHELMIIQELLEIEYDIRVLIYNNNFLGAIKRTSADGFYTNVSMGGKAESIDLKREEIELSIKACCAAGISFGGVDFARTPKGIRFFEINKSPQIKGFQTASGINVPFKLVEEIKNYLDSK